MTGRESASAIVTGREAHVEGTSQAEVATWWRVPHRRILSVELKVDLGEPARTLSLYPLEPMRRISSVLLLGALGAATLLGAQAPTPGVPTPPALARLAPLVGEWTMATLPTGATLRETCEWFVGERHVVCQMRSRSATWQRGALTVFSYDPADSTYAMTAFGSGGQQSVARGRARGDTLIFDGELRTGEEPPKRTRVTIVPRADGFDLTEQEADGKGGWRNSARIRYVPVPR